MLITLREETMLSARLHLFRGLLTWANVSCHFLLVGTARFTIWRSRVRSPAINDFTLFASLFVWLGRVYNVLISARWGNKRKRNALVNIDPGHESRLMLMPQERSPRMDRCRGGRGRPRRQWYSFNLAFKTPARPELTRSKGIYKWLLYEAEESINHWKAIIKKTSTIALLPAPPSDQSVKIRIL